MNLRAAVLTDLTVGAEVFYTPIRGQRAFSGRVDSEPFQLGHGAWVVHVDQLEPSYGEFVGRPERTRVAAATLEALFVRAEAPSAPRRCAKCGLAENEHDARHNFVPPGGRR